MRQFFLLFLLLVPAAHADVLGDLDGLLARQKADSGNCNKFRKKWHGVVKGGLSRDSASHVSRQQALDALKLLEKFPYHGAAPSKAWAFLVEHQDELAQLPDQKAVVDRIGRIEPPCEVFSRHVHRHLLLKDVEALKLSKKEAKTVARNAYDYLRNGGTGTMAGLAMKLDFLVDYLGTVYDGANREALKAKASALRQEYEAGRELNKIEQKALSDAGKGDTVAWWGPDFKLWGKVNASLERLLAELES